MTSKELYDLGFILEIHTISLDVYETGFESNFPNEKVESIMSEYNYDFADTRFNLLDLDGNIVIRNCSYDDIERYVENL